MSLALEGSRRAQRTRVVILGLVLALIASALASPARAQVGSAVNPFCNPNDGTILLRNKMERIFPQGYEVWERWPVAYNEKTGRWSYLNWVEPNLWELPGNRSQRSRTLLPNEFVIDLNNTDIGFQAVLAPGFYQFGIYYRWWYSGSLSMPWNSTGWLWAAPRVRCVTVPFALTFPVQPLASARADASLQRSVARLRGLAVSARRGTHAHAAVGKARCFGRRATIVGTEASELIAGSERADVIVGLDGDDTIVGLGGRDLICGGPGDDGLSGVNDADRLWGGEGDDAFLGGDGRDLILGGPGTDIMEGDAGADRLDGGGDALDIVAYLSAPAGVEVDFARGQASGGEGRDRFRGMNAVVGSGFADRLTGGRGEQWFAPLAGDDRVEGRGGETDVLVYTFALQGVSVDLEARGGQALGEGHDRLSGLEIVFGSPYADLLAGTSAYNLLVGAAGDDELDGRGGEDTLEGSAGADVCLNGAAYFECENQPADVIVPQAPEPAPGSPPETPASAP